MICGRYRVAMVYDPNVMTRILHYLGRLAVGEGLVSFGLFVAVLRRLESE